MAIHILEIMIMYLIEIIQGDINMKKVIYGMLLTVAFASCFTGCGKKDDEATTQEKVAEFSPEVKEEIISFVNDGVAAKQEDRKAAIDIYNSYFTEDKVDLEAFKSKLNDEAIPKMQGYIDDISAIEAKSDDVKELKELFLLGAQKQHEAMVMVSSALDTENPEFLTQANSLISESESYITQYETKLRLLTIDYNIDVNGQFTSAATVDSETQGVDGASEAIETEAEEVSE